MGRVNKPGEALPQALESSFIFAIPGPGSQHGYVAVPGAAFGRNQNCKVCHFDRREKSPAQDLSLWSK